MKTRLGAAILALSTVAVAASAATVFSSKIRVDGNDSTFIFGLATAPAYVPPNASLLFSSPGPSGTSHIVVWADGTSYDLNSAASRTVVSTMTGTGSGTGAFVQAVYDLNAVPLRVTVRYEIDDNPQSGVSEDTMKVKLGVENRGGAPITYGLRLMYDTMIDGNDGANISVDNGFSVVTNNTLYTQAGAGVPGNWWGYDVAPPGVPDLVGRASIWGNPFGEPATMPDALEVAQWGAVTGTGQWNTATAGAAIGDSAVVLWWTGTGGAGIPTLSLAPGARRDFVTYYGIDGGVLLSTFTPTPVPGTPTHSPTITPTPSITVTPTITPTFSASETFTLSPTFSISPTFSATSTLTPTLTPTPRPLALKLLPPNPHPASTEAWLPYFLSTDANVDIQLWTLAGEQLKGWDAGWRLAGYREEKWDLRNEAGHPVASGVYVYRIRAVSAKGEEEQDYSKCAVAR